MKNDKYNIIAIADWLNLVSVLITVTVAVFFWNDRAQSNSVLILFMSLVTMWSVFFCVSLLFRSYARIPLYLLTKIFENIKEGTEYKGYVLKLCKIREGRFPFLMPKAFYDVAINIDQSIDAIKENARLVNEAEKAQIADDFFHSIKNYVYALEIEAKVLDGETGKKISRIASEIGSKASYYRKIFSSEKRYSKEIVVENIGLLMESIAQDAMAGDGVQAIVNNDIKGFYYLYSNIEIASVRDAIMNLVVNARQEVAKFKDSSKNVSIKVIDRFTSVKIEISNETLNELPEHVVSKINEKINSTTAVNKAKNNFTYGKDNGGGIGLDAIGDAIKVAEGSIEFSYSERTATFIISLPKASIPMDEMREIVLYEGDNIVLIDDTEPYLYGALTKTFSVPGLNVLQFTNTISALMKIRSLQESKESVRVFIDWNLGHTTQNGLDFVTSNKLENLSTVITQESDRQNFRKLQKDCFSNKVKVIHKQILGAGLPMYIKYRDELSAVVIDDNLFYYNSSKRIVAYQRFIDFLRFWESINLDTKIYLDINREEDWDIKDCVKWLIEHKFTNVVIQTGDSHLYTANNFGLEVISKQQFMAEISELE